MPLVVPFLNLNRLQENLSRILIILKENLFIPVHQIYLKTITIKKLNGSQWLPFQNRSLKKNKISYAPA